MSDIGAGNTQEQQFDLDVSPLVRLAMAFSEDLRRDSSGVLLSLRAEYLQRLQRAEEKRDQITRSLFIFDAVLFFLLSGQAFVIPIFNIQTGSIPAVIEILTVVASLSFVFVALQFVTSAAYGMILRQYANATAIDIRNKTIPPKYSFDPDYMLAAITNSELSIKLIRETLNLAGPDYYLPTGRFWIVSRVTNAMIRLMLFTFPIVHVAIVVMSVRHSLMQYGVISLVWFYITMLVLLHVLAVMIMVSTYTSFRFTADFSKPPWPY